ncbi:MAG: Zn-ribbon domain-containing OB-fold protein [Oscillospiraceae bacterium]
MEKIGPIVKQWYTALSNGKIMGKKCTRCGAVSFPPVPVCNSCGCMKMEDIEISGEAEMTTFSFSPLGVPPYTEDPVMCGFFRLKEGPLFMSWLMDVDEDDQDALFAKLPVAVKAEITTIDEENHLSFPVFRLVEELD